jgi:hypothetical protein
VNGSGRHFTEPPRFSCKKRQRIKAKLKALKDCQKQPGQGLPAMILPYRKECLRGAVWLTKAMAARGYGLVRISGAQCLSDRAAKITVGSFWMMQSAQFIGMS